MSDGKRGFAWLTVIIFSGVAAALGTATPGAWSGRLGAVVREAQGALGFSSNNKEIQASVPFASRLPGDVTAPTVVRDVSPVSAADAVPADAAVEAPTGPAKNPRRDSVTFARMGAVSPSGYSSASTTVEVAAAPSAAAPSVAEANAPKVAVATPRSHAASRASIHYGVTSRNEVMARAVGPVYNLAGALALAKRPVASPAKGATYSLDGVQAALDSANMSEADRAAINEKLRQAKKELSESAQ